MPAQPGPPAQSPPGLVGIEKLRAETQNTLISTQTLIVKAWPSPELADRLIYIGLGALSSGGIAFVAAGYPGISARAVPAIFAWTIGLVLLAFGLRALARHDRIRMDHFLTRFEVQVGDRGSPERIGVFGRIAAWMRRRWAGGGKT